MKTMDGFKKLAASCLTGVCIALAVTGCNKDNGVFNPDDTGGGNTSGEGTDSAQLQLIVSKVGSLLNQNTWKDGNTLGLFLTEGTLGRPYMDKEADYYNIKAYMFAGRWYLTPEIVSLYKDEAVVYAYSPYKKNVDPFAVPVETESRTDYMYGTHLSSQKAVDADSPIATLEMQHALSLLEINIRKNHDFKSRAFLSEISIEAAGDSLKLPVKGTMDIMTGEVTPDGYGRYALEKLNTVLPDVYTDSCSYRMTMMPRDNGAEEVQLSIVVNGNKLSIPLNEDQDWVQGVHNIYNIVFDGTDMRVEKVELVPWKEVYIEGEIEGR